MSVFSLWDKWECLYEILTGHLLLCSSVWELEVGPVSVVPLWGHLLVRGTREFPEGGPVTQAGKPRKQHHLGDQCTQPAGWQSIKEPQPTRSLYTLQGLLKCECCCFSSDPWGAAVVFVTLLRACIHCSVWAIYVSLCRMTVCSQRPWQNAQNPFGEPYFSLKGQFHCFLFFKQNFQKIFLLICLSISC